jgi:hypothetical protein
MEVRIDVKGVAGVQAMLNAFPKQASRAAEMALDATAKVIKGEIRSSMATVFSNPTPYTLNSLKVTPTRNHNMKASVWFKEPDRMGQHYLIPQVDGGKRRLKGFERGIALGELVPGKIGARINQYGNVSPGQIKQIMSVLGRAETSSGYSANITARSRKRNKKERDYVVIYHKHGRLLPGVYQRTQTGVGFGAKTKRTFADQSKAYQKGRTNGRFASVIRSRGLKPIFLMGKKATVKPRLDFYGIAHATFDREFSARFWSHLNKIL